VTNSTKNNRRIKENQTILKGRFLGWNIDQGFPDIEIFEEMGHVGDIEQECLALLYDQNICLDEFS
jgi:hypothetical protein